VRPRVLAVAVALALVAPGAPRAAETGPARVRLALDKLRVRDVQPALAQVVEDRVCAALGERAGLEVVCPADVAAAALLARNAALFGECKADDCMKRVDDVKAADQRVGGAIEKGEKGLVLSLQLTTTSGPGPRVVEKLPDDVDAIVARIPGIVKKLFP
jgi:hypothetical protein